MWRLKPAAASLRTDRAIGAAGGRSRSIETDSRPRHFSAMASDWRVMVLRRKACVPSPGTRGFAKCGASGKD